MRIHRAKKTSNQEKTVITTWSNGVDTSCVVFRRKVDPVSGFPIVCNPAVGAEVDVAPTSDKFGRIDLMAGGVWACLPGLPSGEWTYESKSQHITFTPKDADVVKNLFYWGMQSLYKYSLHDVHNPLISFRNVCNSHSSGVMISKFDSVCLVLSPPTRHLAASSSGTTAGSYVVKLWDASLASRLLFNAAGPGMHVQLGELEKEMGNVFAHCMGWPVDLLTTLYSGTFCPSLEDGDLTSVDDLQALNQWFLPRIDQFMNDKSLINHLKEDILNNYATVQIDDAGIQDHFLREHAKPGSWIRLRDLEAEFKQPENGLPGVTTFKISRTTHINKVLPYFR